MAKVGLELYSASGPDAITSLMEQGYDVFVDLKLLDIPTTVNKAARVLGSLGAHYLTLHARGDGPMLRGRRGRAARRPPSGRDWPSPSSLAVTVLTSDAGAPPHIFPHRVALAAEAGCGGIVCAAADLAEARQLAPRLLRVVPGIRPGRHRRPRSGSGRRRPGLLAFDGGADLLVVGRTVTEADDPVAAVAALPPAELVAEPE